MTIENNLKDQILESIGEGVFTVDKNFKINFFNKAAEKITGYKREEVVGRFCKHIFRSELCASDCPIALVLKSSKPIYEFESCIKDFKGRAIPIKLNSSVLFNEKNEPSGGIITFRDVSELNKLISELSQSDSFLGIIGKSKQMREIFNLISEISESNAPVFIHGESGTGKEMVANAIQKTSLRANENFVKINCSVFPSNLLASELFGHVKGAFTDAVKDRPGRFELADKGTIFLDEVAEMPAQMQLQLLRVLQEGTFERIGDNLTRKADVRIISATNINIKAALAKGTFREDLFYRLSVIPIEIPPLRERMDDLIPLANFFTHKFSLIYKKGINLIDEKAFEILHNYSWPGNIRELENVLEYALVRTNNSNIIDSSKLPASLKINSSKPFGIIEKYSFQDDNSEIPKYIALLDKHRWNKTKVAKELGIGRTTLWRKLIELGLESKENFDKTNSET